jgi:hypothetical protein
LKELLPRFLDQDTFYISSSRVQEKQLSQIDFLVNQVDVSSSPSKPELAFAFQTRAIAVVDRTADINLAAKAITTARLSPHNTSPYAPDVIIVNDFVCEDFRRACLKYASLAPLNTLEKKVIGAEAETIKLLKATETEGKAKIHSDSVSGLSVVEVSDRYVRYHNCSET